MNFYVDLDAPTGHQIVESSPHHRDRHFLPAGGSYDECVVALVEAGGIFCPPRGSPETIEVFTARIASEASARLAAKYVAECRRLFDAGRYGWSVWEQESVEEGFAQGEDPAETVARMNYQYQIRRANRSV